MIICKNYQPGYTAVENNETVFYVFAELYTGAVPSPLPQNAGDIENFPQNYPPQNVRFAAGSTLFCADTGAVYLTNDSGVWKAQ